MITPTHKHEPTSTMRPPPVRRSKAMSETMREYLDWRDVVDAEIDAVIARHRAAFVARFFGGAS